MIKVKSHKRSGKNRVSVVRSHGRVKSMNKTKKNKAVSNMGRKFIKRTEAITDVSPKDAKKAGRDYLKVSKTFSPGDSRYKSMDLHNTISSRIPRARKNAKFGVKRSKKGVPGYGKVK